MKDQLLKFMNREQLSSAKFAESIGVQPSSISHILSGRNKPGFDFIHKILTRYPALSAEWLILGKGNMMKSAHIQRDLFSEKDIEPDPGKEFTVKKDDNLHEENAKVQLENKEITNVTYSGDSGDDISESDKNRGVTNVKDGKYIEKIVVLYSDKSFVEYSPG